MKDKDKEIEILKELVTILKNQVRQKESAPNCPDCGENMDKENDTQAVYKSPFMSFTTYYVCLACAGQNEEILNQPYPGMGGASEMKH